MGSHGERGRPASAGGGVRKTVDRPGAFDAQTTQDGKNAPMEEEGAVGARPRVSERENDPRLTAGVDLVRRCGAKEIDIRFCEETTPVVWMAVATFSRQRWEVAAGHDPLDAVLRLCDQLLDGGECKHCHRITGCVWDVQPMPLSDAVCWYQWDPELKTFRRGCEGE